METHLYIIELDEPFHCASGTYKWCMGALEVGRGSSSRLGTAAGPRRLGYLFLPGGEQCGGAILLIQALKLALVHVGLWIFLFSSFVSDGRSLGVQHDILSGMHACTFLLYHASLFCMCHPLKDNGGALVCKKMILSL